MITITFNPAEWKLVPKLPTREMYEETWETRQYVAFDRFIDDYEAMLAAAPQPPEAAPVQMPEQELQTLMDSIEEYGRASFEHGLRIVDRINAKQSKAVFKDAHALWEQCQSIQHQVRELLNKGTKSEQD